MAVASFQSYFPICNSVGWLLWLTLESQNELEKSVKMRWPATQINTAVNLEVDSTISA